MTEEKKDCSQMPEIISDTPENLMRMLVNTPPTTELNAKQEAQR